MPITFPSVPVLRGAQGAELRSEPAGLLLRGPRGEVRIPLAAVARVHADGRAVAIELTAPAGTEPTRYRIEGVPRASATVFGEAVNGLLPERPADEDPVDGSTLVTVTREAAEDAEREAREEREARALREREAEEDAEPRTPAALAVTAVMVALGLGLVALTAGVVIAGDHVSRALAVLLLGATTLLTVRLTIGAAAVPWNKWYLPRHGVTVETVPTLIRGQVRYGYTATDGKVRRAPHDAQATPYDIAYHLKHPARAVVCGGLDAHFWKRLCWSAVSAAVTALLGWATLALALPAFA
ncbi:hypothetical protein AB0D99_19850 [Streptomyces sp. NPDC047971]|uniref:hypothetical protein n=1 Tax=Streptomyces sp. NPDC047971 TaxID=3154499 RepID=UPI00340A5EF8